MAQEEKEVCWRCSGSGEDEWAYDGTFSSGRLWPKPKLCPECDGQGLVEDGTYAHEMAMTELDAISNT